MTNAEDENEKMVKNSWTPEVRSASDARARRAPTPESDRSRTSGVHR
jgi:hypothetical protein